MQLNVSGRVDRDQGGMVLGLNSGDCFVNAERVVEGDVKRVAHYYPSEAFCRTLSDLAIEAATGANRRRLFSSTSQPKPGGR